MKAITIPLRIDIKGAKISQGDFQVGEIAQKLDPYLEGIADEMAKICIGRKSLVFQADFIQMQRDPVTGKSFLKGPDRKSGWQDSVLA